MTLNGVPIMCATKKKQSRGQTAVTRTVAVTRRGARMTLTDIYNALGACSSRCLDDEDDTMAVAKFLASEFKIYQKVVARRVQRKV